MRPLRSTLLVFLVAFLAAPVGAAAESVLVEWVSAKGPKGPDTLGSLSPRTSDSGEYVLFTEYDASMVGEPAWPDCSGGRPLHLPCVQLVRRSEDSACRVTRRLNGEPILRPAPGHSITPDGTRLAWAAWDPDIVANDNNGIRDAFVADGCAKPVRVTVSSSGEEARPLDDERPDAGDPCRYYCPSPVLSPDGGFVGFSSWADNLDANDSNNWPDVFVRDLRAGTTVAVSRNPEGRTANGPSYLHGEGSPVSRDGARVVFLSMASDLVTGTAPRCPEDIALLPASWDIQACPQAYLWDRATGKVTRVSVAEGAEGAERPVNAAVISADGNYVFFASRSLELQRALGYEPTEGLHVFRRHVESGDLLLVSVAPGGSPSEGNHHSISHSLDGNRIAWISDATDLVAGDSNGVDDVFVRDIPRSKTVRASIDERGHQLQAAQDPEGLRAPGVGHAHLAPDGQAVAWVTRGNVVAADKNGVYDVFLTRLGPLFGESTLAPSSDVEPRPPGARGFLPGTAGAVTVCALVLAVVVLAFRKDES